MKIVTFLNKCHMIDLFGELCIYPLHLQTTGTSNFIFYKINSFFKVE